MNMVFSYWIEDALQQFQEIALHKTVPETNTGGLVEHTKALERTALKELGKMPP